MSSRHAVESQLLAPVQNAVAQPAHQAHGIGTLLHHVGAADRFDADAPAVAQADANPVTLDKAAGFVGDDVRDFDGIEAAVDLAGEDFELRPELFLAGHLAEHLAR